MNLQNLSRVASWGLIAFIVFVTVCPIEFRPQTETTVDLDRSLAFVATGFLFAFAYPARWKEILVLFPLFAFGSEVLQFLASTRHPHLADATYKAAGAFGGAGLGHVAALGLAAWQRKGVPSA